MIEVSVSLNEVGMAVDARINGGDWVGVQLTKYRVRAARPSVRQYSTYIDPASDQAEYFETLDARGVKYRRVQRGDET